MKPRPCHVGLLTMAITMSLCQAEILTLIGPSVNNGSFELLKGVPNAAKATHWDTDSDGDVNNWTLWTVESTASNDSGTETAGNATNGTKRGYLQNGNAVYNLTTRLAAAGDNFTIAWDHIAGTGAPITGWIVYDDGGTITKLPASKLISPAGGFRRTLSFTIPAGSPAIEKAIGVGFKSGGGWPALDNVVFTLPVGDADGDGMQDDWETANGLNPNSSAGVDGASGDADNDGLSNLGEFLAGTKINDNDSDDDGLLDGPEVTGSSNLYDGSPTDPLDADTDDDTISDAQENGSLNGTFANQPSNPHAGDTDSDGFTDSAELLYHTNPSDGSSIPYLLSLIGPDANNGSFELLNGLPSLAKAPHWDTAAAGDVTNWTLWPVESTASNDSGTESGGATQGSKKGFLQPGNAVYNMTARPAKAGEIYAMSWDHVAGSGAPLTSWMTYNDGGTITKILATEVISTTAGGRREFFYTIPAGSPAFGKTIGVGFKCTTGNYPGLDNVVLTVPTTDLDGDGMPNEYEVAHGLNPNIGTGANGASGDPDNDGLTNIQEMAAGTHPNDNDTDDDGALDGPEIAGTSNLFDGTPTDPLDPDSDDDRIPDGQENGALTGLFGNLPTNPHSFDTDGDSFGDAAESIFKTNPLSSGSFPFLLALIGPNVNNGSFEQLNGSFNPAKATHWDTDPDGDVNNWTVWPGESTAENDSGAEIGITTDGSKRAFLQFGNAVYNMTTKIAKAGDVFSLTWDHLAGSGTPLVAWITYDDNGTVTKIPGTELVSIDRGVRREVVYEIPVGSPAIGKAIGAGFRSAGLWAGLDNVVLAIPATDTDSDGLPDDWETANGLDPNSANGLNGPSGDPDNDGLGNLAEFNTGTAANDNDSDNDGSLDGAEVSGTANRFDSSPTDPLDSDSDDDGLLDGQENGELNTAFANQATNPHAADTDSDGVPDSRELFYRSNPADSASVPALVTLIGPDVNNGSFELLDGPDNAAKATHWDADADGNVPNWTVWPSESTAQNDSGTETGATTNGTKRAFLQNGNAVYNMTSRFAQAGEIYGLSWDHTGGGGPLTAWITYNDGGIITKIPATEKISPGRGDGRAFIYTIPAGSPAIGKRIGVGFKSTGDYPSLDNVILTLGNAQSGGPDSDNDGMEDAWETTWFGGLSQNGAGDFDNPKNES